MLPVQTDGIPAELSERRQWMLWRWEWQGPDWRKIPYQVCGRRGKVNDSGTWDTFAAALARYQTSSYDGVAYVITGDDPYVGIDLDDCRTPDTGAISERALAIIRRLDSYAEVSPTATGVKLLVRARKPAERCVFPLREVGLAQVEVYERGRYWCITGRRVDGAPAAIRERQEALDELYGCGFSPGEGEELPDHISRQLEEAEREAHRSPASNGHRPSLEERAIAYLRHCPPAISGQAGHAVTFRVARAIVYGFGLGAEAGYRLLAKHYNPRCRPPWSARELRHKCADADSTPCNQARGWLRDAGLAVAVAVRANGRHWQTDRAPPPCDPQGEAAATDERPQILITTRQKDVNDQAIVALARFADLYHRAGLLVRVVHDASPGRHIRRAQGASRILPITPATLREEMAAAAHWQRREVRGEGKVQIVAAHPPDWSVRAVHERGHWPALRYLAGVVEAPTLRPDGSILDRPGYDPDTGLIYQPSADYPPVPASPTLEDARRAAQELLSLVDEFPFVGPAHSAAWLAAVLTVLARPAIAGPCPLILFEAPVAGSGKTLLADLVGIIATGREPPASRLSESSEEVGKAITAILLEGERLVLFDNADGNFGCKSLDAILTKEIWKDRLLGVTERTPELPNETVWMATGNNLRLVGDILRRVLPCRLVPTAEKPEERDGFRIPDLKGHARQHRPALVVAALTILRSHTMAGRPTAQLPSFGSYEAWSAVVRQAIHWATGLDPWQGRDTLDAAAKDANTEIRALFAAWSRLPGGKGPGVTAKDAIRLAAKPTSPNNPDEHADLREVLATLGKGGEPADSSSLGYHLRRSRDKVAGTWILRAGDQDRNGYRRWFVEVVASQPKRGAEDAEDAEDVSCRSDLYPGRPRARGAQEASSASSASSAPAPSGPPESASAEREVYEL